MQGEVIISENYLDGVISKFSKRIVGRILKRFEVFEQNDTALSLSDSKILVKALMKEILYEEMRNLKDYLCAYSHGIIFKSKNK
jgi:hypothetical protein